MFTPGENQGAPPPKPTKSCWRNMTHAEWVEDLLLFAVVGEPKMLSMLTKTGMIHFCNTDSHNLNTQEMLPW